jgi:hypothetical protein
VASGIEAPTGEIPPEILRFSIRINPKAAGSQLPVARSWAAIAERSLPLGFHPLFYPLLSRLSLAFSWTLLAKSSSLNASLLFLSSFHHLPKVTFSDNRQLTPNHIWHVYIAGMIF